jgi:predicted dehydrogenase
VVVIGTGFGARVHVPAFLAAGFRVEALVGRDHDRTERRARRLGLRGLTSVEEALGLPGVDAVSIAGPPDTHHPLVLEAVAAGRHIVCEKPFALDAGQAREMASAAERSGVVAFVGHEFRWAPERALVGRLIADGRVGEPRLATLISYVPLVADLDVRVPAWWFDARRGGGWLGASGSHVVDQARTWLGDVAEVVGAATMTSARVVGAPDSFSMVMRMVNGARVVAQQSAGAWGAPVNVTRVAGTAGTVWIDDGGAVWLSGAGATDRVPVPPDLEVPPPPPPATDPRHRFTQLELGPYTRLAEAFAERIRGVRASSPVQPATFADGVACMEVLDQVRAGT